MFAFTTCWNGPKGRASISIFRRRPALVSTAVTQTAGCVLAVFHWGWLEKQMLHLSKPRVAQTLTQLWAQVPGSSPKRWPPKPAHVCGVSFKPALSCISSQTPVCFLRQIWKSACEERAAHTIYILGGAGRPFKACRSRHRWAVALPLTCARSPPKLTKNKEFSASRKYRNDFSLSFKLCFVVCFFLQL